MLISPRYTAIEWKQKEKKTKDSERRKQRYEMKNYKLKLKKKQEGTARWTQNWIEKKNKRNMIFEFSLLFIYLWQQICVWMQKQLDLLKFLVWVCVIFMRNIFIFHEMSKHKFITSNGFDSKSCDQDIMFSILFFRNHIQLIANELHTLVLSWN